MKNQTLGTSIEYVYRDIAKTGLVTAIVFGVLIGIYFLV